MNIQQIAKCKQIADHYGFDSQREMLIEECAELIKEAAKMVRVDITDAKQEYKAWQNFAGELADVTIMVEQIKYMLTPGLTQEYEQMITQKLDRQIERIEKEKVLYK